MTFVGTSTLIAEILNKAYPCKCGGQGRADEHAKLIVGAYSCASPLPSTLPPYWKCSCANAFGKLLRASSVETGIKTIVALYVCSHRFGMHKPCDCVIYYSSLLNQVITDKISDPPLPYKHGLSCMYDEFDRFAWALLQIAGFCDSCSSYYANAITHAQTQWPPCHPSCESTTCVCAEPIKPPYTAVDVANVLEWLDADPISCLPFPIPSSVSPFAPPKLEQLFSNFLPHSKQQQFGL